jgi:hypothetical protein
MNDHVKEVLVYMWEDVEKLIEMAVLRQKGDAVSNLRAQLRRKGAGAGGLRVLIIDAADAIDRHHHTRLREAIGTERLNDRNRGALRKAGDPVQLLAHLLTGLRGIAGRKS